MDRRGEYDLAGESEDSLFERFVRYRDNDAYALLYQRLKEGLLGQLQKDFSGLGGATHDDIIQDAFVKLRRTPETFWNPQSGRPPKAFSILAKVVQNQARDILRREGKFPKTSLDENVTIAIVEDGETVTQLDELDHKRAPHEARQMPSAAEMEKVLRDYGTLSERDESLFQDLNNPDFWPDDETKPDYQKLAERHGTTIGNIQQRVSRLRRSVIQRHGGKMGFLAAAARVLAWLRETASRISNAPRSSSAVAILMVATLWWLLAKRESVYLPSSSSGASNIVRAQSVGTIVGESSTVASSLLEPSPAEATGVFSQRQLVGALASANPVVPWEEIYGFEVALRFYGLSKHGRYMLAELADLEQNAFRHGYQKVPAQLTFMQLPILTQSFEFAGSNPPQKRDDDARATFGAATEASLTFLMQNLSHLRQKGDEPDTVDVSPIPGRPGSAMLDIGGFLRFSTNDVRDIRALVSRLRKHGDPVSEYLWARIPALTQQELMTNMVSSEIKRAFVDQLAETIGQIMWDDTFYDQARFGALALSHEVRELIESRPKGERLVRLNRALLEGAFPGEIKKNRNLFAQPELSAATAYNLHAAVLELVAEQAHTVSVHSFYERDKEILLFCTVPFENHEASGLQILVHTKQDGEAWVSRIYFVVAPSMISTLTQGARFRFNSVELSSGGVEFEGVLR